MYNIPSNMPSWYILPPWTEQFRSLMRRSYCFIYFISKYLHRFFFLFLFIILIFLFIFFMILLFDFGESTFDFVTTRSRKWFVLLLFVALSLFVALRLALGLRLALLVVIVACNPIPNCLVVWMLHPWSGREWGHAQVFRQVCRLV